MEDNKAGHEEKKPYVEPRVLATYKKEELEETIKPHGVVGYVDNGDGGGGCG